MSLDLTRKVQTTFNLAVMRHEVSMRERAHQSQRGKELAQQDRDKDAAQDIVERHNKRRDELHEHYRETYDTRIAEARQIVQREIAQMRQQPRPPYELGAARTDQFDTELIDRRAAKLVERDLQRDLMSIDQDETQDLQTHFETASYSDAAPSRDYQSRTTERENAPDQTQNASLAQAFQPVR
ncbi:hypothetical protein [Coralliovum pocilloporae]|uniref:hypothetical protein n=1 Tax=Coralliovum pocilloporae TaxID=3066369 RepID=UPI0033075D02